MKPQKNNQRLKLCLLTLLLSLTFNNTYAVFGVGDIVSDPGSYGYYVEQLKSMSDQLEQFNEINEKTDQILNDAHEIFNFSKGVQNKFKDEQAIYNTYRNTLNGLQRKKLDFSRGFDPKDLRDVIDINLDGIYVDPDDPLFNTDYMKKSRNYERQRLLKQSLIKSEEKLTEVGQSYELINEYAKQAQQTRSVKASNDLQNTILLEILKSVNSLVEVMSTLGQAEMALKYTHYNKEQHENHVQAQKNRYPNGLKDSYGQIFKNRDEHREHNKKCGNFYKINRHLDTTIDGKDCATRAAKKHYSKK